MLAAAKRRIQAAIRKGPGDLVQKLPCHTSVKATAIIGMPQRARRSTFAARGVFRWNETKINRIIQANHPAARMKYA
jgi:hypothetical protein